MQLSACAWGPASRICRGGGGFAGKGGRGGDLGEPIIGRQRASPAAGKRRSPQPPPPAAAGHPSLKARRAQPPPQGGWGGFRRKALLTDAGCTRSLGPVIP